MKRNIRPFLVATALSLLCGCASHNPPPLTPDGRKLTDDYLRGRSDGVKQLYWNLQEQQRMKAAAESYQLYEVNIPEHWENGVLVKPTQRVLRINE
jgi:hypothetical protein